MINIQHDPLYLRQTYLGPEVPVKIDRVLLSYSSNVAPSYIPSRLFSADYFSHLKLQKDRVLAGWPEGSPVIVENYVNKIKVDVPLLMQLGDDLRNHLENRIQILFTQLVLLYKTQIWFKLCTRADVQAGQVLSKANSEGCYAAAHSGTLPTLRLYQSEISSTSVSFAQNSSFYYGWNTTVYLPEVVNQVDSKIDRWTRHELNGIDLRTKTTDILNQISSGNISPKQGLRDFLISLVNVLESLKCNCRDEISFVVIDKYLVVASGYLDNVDNGYPLIQKLLLRPIDEIVNDVFYLNVQEEMHNQLKAEMQQFRPKAVLIPMLPRDVNLRGLQEEIGCRVWKLNQENGEVCESYVKVCTLADAVRSAAVQYFIFLHNLSPVERSGNLDSLLRIKTFATIQKVNLSSSSFFLYDEARKAISAQSKSQDPRNMAHILFSVLIAIGQDIGLNHLPLIQGMQPQSLYSKRCLEWRIWQKIVAANMMSTGKVSENIECSSLEDRVCMAAMHVFSEMLYLPDSIKDSAIDKLLQIKTVKTISPTLGPKSLWFYSEVLGAIRKKNQKNDLNPQNMGLILCSLLLKIRDSVIF